MSTCKLVISRKKQFVASLAEIKIIIDDDEFGNISNGNHFNCTLNSGEHVIKFKWVNKTNEFTILIPQEIEFASLILKIHQLTGNIVLSSKDIIIKKSLGKKSTEVKRELECVQATSDDEIERFIIQTPNISLNEGEVCYYCNKASSFHQKNVVTGRTSGSAGVSVRIAKGFSVRTGGGNSRVIRENVDEYFDGTLYITNIRIILLAPKYGFDLFISKISQLEFTYYGFQIFSGSKSYQVATKDKKNLQKLIGLMNSQGVFKDEKWLKKQQLHSNSTNADESTLKKELSDLKWLLDEGIITQEEFDAKKKTLLEL